jgi:hypothetical protein
VAAPDRACTAQKNIRNHATSSAVPLMDFSFAELAPHILAPALQIAAYFESSTWLS